MKTSINANTNGKGQGTDEQRLVTIIRLGFGYQSTTLYPEDPWKGELRAYFEPSGFGPGSWNVDGYGNICGDRQWIREFKLELRQLGLSRAAVQTLKYNGLGLQGRDYVSLDAGTAFYKSWQRLIAKKEKEVA